MNAYYLSFKGILNEYLSIQLLKEGHCNINMALFKFKLWTILPYLKYFDPFVCMYVFLAFYLHEMTCLLEYFSMQIPVALKTKAASE